MLSRMLPARRPGASPGTRPASTRGITGVAWIAALWLSTAPSPAGAAPLAWNGTADDFASNPLNWTPAQAPTAADDLTFPNLGTQFINFGASVPASRSWRVLGIGLYDFFVTARHTVGLDLVVGDGVQHPTVSLATTDTVVIDRDIEMLSGLVNVQQGCRVIGVDSVRVTRGNFNVRDLNTIVFARDVLVGTTGTVGFVNVTRGRLFVSQSMRANTGGVSVGYSTARLQTPTLYTGPSVNVQSSLQGLIDVAGEFTLDGLLGLDDGRVAASPLRASSTSSISGTGVVDGPFLMEGGYLAVYNGKLTVGDAGDPGGVALEGFVQVDGDSELECLSASPVELPISMIANRATLRAPTGFVLGDADQLSASGLIAGDFDMTGGVFSFPYIGLGPEKLAVQGDWSMGATASMVMNVHDLAPGWAADSLVVTGTAQPGGTLEIYTPYPGPGAGESIPFLFYASRPAQAVFDVVLLNGMPVTNELQVIYNADHALLQFGGQTGVGGSSAVAAALALSGRGGANASFVLDLPADAAVTLEVFDLTGRRVAGLHDGALGAGRHLFAVADAAAPGRLASGVYFGRATVRTPDGRVESRSGRLALTR